MYKRRVFTLDPDYFPLKRMREIIDHLHANGQQYGKCSHLNSGFISDKTLESVLMTDPAIGYLPQSGYEPYDRGKEFDIWIKVENGSDFLGVVWPGKRVYLVSHNFELILPLKVRLSFLVNNPSSWRCPPF